MQRVHAFASQVAAAKAHRLGDGFFHGGKVLRGLAPPGCLMFEGSDDDVPISAIIYIKEKFGVVLGGVLYLQ